MKQSTILLWRQRMAESNSMGTRIEEIYSQMDDKRKLIKVNEEDVQFDLKRIEANISKGILLKMQLEELEKEAQKIEENNSTEEQVR